VVISVDDPRNKKIIDYVNNITLKKIVIVNDRNLGCGLAIKTAIDRGFSYGDRVIHLEDDIIVSNDALNYFEHALNAHEDNERVIGVCGFSRSDGPVSQYSLVQDWYPWGWATWKDRWKHLKAVWPDRNWDANLKKYLMKYKYLTAKPTLARTRHIGYEGIHVDIEMWKRKWDAFPWIGDRGRGVTHQLKEEDNE